MGLPMFPTPMNPTFTAMRASRVRDFRHHTPGVSIPEIDRRRIDEGRTKPEGGPMRYMLLIGSDDKNAPPRPRAEMETLVASHRRFSGELQAAGKMVAGERLRP